MTAYRKIKIFKFSDFSSYEECQESANDYWAEVNAKKVDAEIVLNVDFIAVVLKKVDVITVKGQYLASIIKRNGMTRDTNTYLQTKEGIVANDKWK